MARFILCLLSSAVLWAQFRPGDGGLPVSIPTKAPGYASNRTAWINANGQLDSVQGATSNCVKVNGTSTACSSDVTTTRGDLTYRGASGLLRLPIGTNLFCLTSNGTDPIWAACASSFNGRTGAVVPTTGDYTAAQVTNAFDLSANNALGAHSETFTDIATPSNPSAGATKFYSKGGKVCSLDSTGSETCTGGGGYFSVCTARASVTGATSVDFSTSGSGSTPCNTIKLTLVGNATITIANPPPLMVFLIYQDVPGSRTLAWANASSTCNIDSATTSFTTQFITYDGTSSTGAGCPNSTDPLGYVFVGVLASIPATCVTGQVAFITNATAGQNNYYCIANVWTQQLNSGGSSVSVSGPYFVIGANKYLGQFAFPVTVPPTLSILNTAGSSTCTANGDGSYTLATAPVASDNLVACGEAMGANTTLTVAFNCNMAYMGAVTLRCGFGFRESATAKLSIWEFVVVQSAFQYGVAVGEGWTNQTTSGGHNILGFTTTTLLGPVIIGKAYFSGANICFQASNDGISFTEAKCEAKTTFFTTAPDQWFVFGSSGQTSQTLYTQILSFKRQ